MSIVEKGKTRVIFFQRKPRAGFTFSFEFIFQDIRNRLQDKIEPIVKISSWMNEGLLRKVLNTIEAGLRKENCVMHVTGEVHYLAILLKQSSTILTIHDCGMMNGKTGFMYHFTKWLYLDLPVKRSGMITANSEVTKNEIIRFTGCDPKKILVIPVAVSNDFKPVLKDFNRKKPRILQVGVADHKNINRLIEALDSIECTLVIVGKLTEELSHLLSRHRINFENYHNLTREELLEQYAVCDILAFVSTFEGFGMPIIEANAVERAVITSNVYSMPEVAGDSACLVDPHSVNDIRKGIEKIISDEAYRNQLIENGRKNRLRFDPDKIADSYLDIYRKLDHQREGNYGKGKLHQ